MKVVVLGAGAIGSVAGTLLANRPEVDRLVIADRSVDAARRLARRLDSGRAEAVKADAGNVDAMAALLKGFDLAINLVLPRFNLRVMDACLRAGTNYMDAATDLALAKEKPGDTVKAPPYVHQLEYDERFRAAGLTALLGMGDRKSVV